MIRNPKELSLLKVLDREYAGSLKTDSERDAHRQRQQRHQEIANRSRFLRLRKANKIQPPESVEQYPRANWGRFGCLACKESEYPWPQPRETSSLSGGL